MRTARVCEAAVGEGINWKLGAGRNRLKNESKREKQN